MFGESIVLSVVQKNIIANMVGKGASAMLSFVFVPFYLKFLGAEAYGLIGLYVLLQSVFMMADMGLSGTFIRETAKLTALEGKKQQLADLCRTFEVLFAAVGFVIALVIVASSHLIAEHWVNLEKLSITTVSATILLIGITIGLQFPFFIYQGGMQGLQRQTPLNILLVSIGLLRGVGALLILAFIDSSIEAYFMWQVVVSVIQLVAGRVLVWRNLLRTPLPPSFDLKLFHYGGLQLVWRVLPLVALFLLRWTS
jgi:O-antigen/teichoic acid export membrane protein